MVKKFTNSLKANNQLDKGLTAYKEQLYNILDSLDAIVYVADMQSYEILFANKYTKDIFGDVTGKICWQTLQFNQTGPCSFCTNDKLLEKMGEPAGVHIWDVQNTANDKFYNIHDRAIRWFDGRIVRLEIALDITERKQFEHKLKISEEKFHTISDYTYDWEYWVDLEGQFLYSSPSCERITGYSAEDFSHDSELILSIIYPEDREQFVSLHKYEDDKEKKHHFDFRIIKPTGEHRWIAHVCQPIYGKDGNYIGRRASNRDITKRKLAEITIEESEAKLKNIFENSSIGINLIPLGDKLMPTGKERVAMINSAMLNFFGYSAEEIRQKTLEEVSHHEDMKKDVALLKKLLAGNCDSYKIEKRFIKKDGKVVWGSLSRSLVRDEQGRPIYIVSNIEDINERKAAEEALQRTHDELEWKVHERTKKLAVANHKLEKEKIKLEEANVALKVLLKRRESDKRNIEDQVVANVNEVVEPYLNKLLTGRLDEKQKKYVDIICANLNNVISPFVHTISSKYLKLTPSELQVANLVRQGRTTDEMSNIMGLSPETVSKHRKKIRRKCGLTNKKINLRTYLLSLSG